jgi:hypothetical protein
MNEKNNSPECERGPDLVAFLYNEAGEDERRDFESHLKECHACREEAISFRVVRESITTWRDEALAGFVSTPLPKKSALAAFRQFFDLSPFWLTGATAFAVLTLCVLAALAIVSFKSNETPIALTPVNQDKVYTAHEVDRMIKEALAKQPEEVVKSLEESPKPKTVKSTTQMAKSRRPLSRAEREQLAADLRLLSTRDEADLQLFGDRINQE